MFKGRKIIALCLTRLSNDETTAKVAELNKALVAKDYRLFVYNACTDFYRNNRLIDCQVKCNKINEKIYKALRGEYENQGVYGDDY